MKWKTKAAMTVAAGLFVALGSARVAHAAPPTDACSLLTPAQVSEALGVAVSVLKAADQSYCQWSQNGKEIGGKGAFIFIVGPIGRLTPVERFNTIKTPLPVKGITKTPVSGLGDDAVYGTAGAAPPELTVKKGNFVFQIKVQGFPRNQVDQIEAKEKALALDVLAKL
jgi:hypothetical protein